MVSSERRNGQPRQRVVRHLGTIRVAGGLHYATPLTARRDFWATVHARLDTLELDAATRASIEAKLAQRVPPLTPAERDELEAHPHAVFEGLKTWR